MPHYSTRSDAGEDLWELWSFAPVFVVWMCAIAAWSAMGGGLWQ